MSKNQPTPANDPAAVPAEPLERRTLLVRATSTAMTASVVAAYGALGATAVRYVYPAKPPATQWLFVAVVAETAVGAAVVWRSPLGATIVVARQGNAGVAEDFIALSSTCPHLGCQVSWEPDKHRFFCPCHNGTFDASGKATGGPPFEAKQSLPRYPLEVRNGLLYIEAPIEKLASAQRDCERRCHDCAARDKDRV